MDIIGEGFPTDTEVTLGFGFEGPEQSSFSCSVKSSSLVEVTLLDGRLWLQQGGPLFLSNITFGESVVSCSSNVVLRSTIDRVGYFKQSHTGPGTLLVGVSRLLMQSATTRSIFSPSS